jgi:hypothetical protein
MKSPKREEREACKCERREGAKLKIDLKCSKRRPGRYNVDRHQRVNL